MRYVVLGVDIDTSSPQGEVDRLIWIQKPGYAPGLLLFLLEVRTIVRLLRYRKRQLNKRRRFGVVIGRWL